MNEILKKLSDGALLNQTKELVAQEREITTTVLWHLKAVSDRRLYAARGYSSLFAYAVNELKYSEAAAARRLAAMKLLVSVPKIASAIETGALNLSTVCAAQNFFKREESEQKKTYSQQEKEQVLDSLKDKSKQEVEKILVSLSPTSVVGPEKVKPVTHTLTELKIYVNDENLKKIEKLRELLAHQNPSGSYGSLIGIIAELALNQVDPERIEARIQKQKREKSFKNGTKNDLANNQEAKSSRTDSTLLAEQIPARKETPNSLKPKNFRYISPSIRRQIFLRDNGRCSFQDPVTSRVCGSRFQVEIEHVQPVSLGGSSEPSNLKILCRNHNLWEGIEKLGKTTMAPYIRVD